MNAEAPKTETVDETPAARAGLRTRVGIGLILLSGVLWFSLFAIPFLPMTIAGKGLLAAILFAGVQVAWWSGAALAGPATVGKIRGWFRRRS